VNAEENREAAQNDAVVGERGIASVNASRSLQSRITNFMAMGLMSVLGVGLLGWYYAHTFSNQRQVKQAAQSASRNQAAGEMALPPLGRVDPPAPAVTQLLGSAPPLPTDTNEAAPGSMPVVQTYPGVAGSAPKPAWEVALERRLGGPVSAGPALAQSGSSALSVADPKPPEGSAATTAASPLAAALIPTATPAAAARVLPAQRLLLPKGAFIDCTLETAIDSTLPGMTTCITATDTFGVDGSTVLIERGSKLVGETRGEVSQGQARVFVLWTEARTPSGVVVPLASPGTDELGRSGLPGEVNHHFFERFGAAILISIINGVVQGAAASQGRGGTLVVDPSASTDVVTEVLKSTVNIPPTVTKPQGDRIQVFVARDLDFRSVYELKTAAH